MSNTGLPDLRLLPDAPVPDGRTVLTSPDATRIEAVRGHRAHLADFHTGYDRITAVCSELHEIASLLEHAPDPDPAWIESLHNLLANGCDSPLYNADVHESELRATLYYARAALLARSE